MRTRVFLVAPLFAAAAAFAQPSTITLINGKAFERAEITAQTAEHVTIRFAGGVAQVEKRMLPDDLRANYPVDEPAAAAERDRQERNTARAEARTDRQREQAQQRADQQARQTQTNTESQAAVADARLDALEGEAKQCARTYFYNRRWGSGSELSLTISVEIESVEPMSGWTNKYRGKGIARVQFWESSSRSYAKREQRFEIVLSTNDRGRVTTSEISEL